MAAVAVALSRLLKRSVRGALCSPPARRGESRSGRDDFFSTLLGQRREASPYPGILSGVERLGWTRTTKCAQNSLCCSKRTCAARRRWTTCWRLRVPTALLGGLDSGLQRQLELLALIGEEVEFLDRPREDMDAVVREVAAELAAPIGAAAD